MMLGRGGGSCPLLGAGLIAPMAQTAAAKAGSHGMREPALG